MVIRPQPSALQAALRGISSGLDGLRRDANAIARAGTVVPAEVADLTPALVDALQHRIQVQASARVVSHVYEAISSLIDALA